MGSQRGNHGGLAELDVVNVVSLRVSPLVAPVGPVAGP